MLLRKTAWLVLGVFLLAFTTAGGIAESQAPMKDPKAAQLSKKKWRVVDGFRSAKFGMSEKQVMQTIAKDFKISKNRCVNFHRALLPINRGWYPHVHSILDGTPTGVTLHLVDENADTGPILVQKEVQLEPIDTADSIYHKLQNEIVLMFKENWIKIKNHEITPTSQDESKSIYHKKSEISSR